VSGLSGLSGWVKFNSIQFKVNPITPQVRRIERGLIDPPLPHELEKVSDELIIFCGF
jgi:hypothetical protein